MPPLEVVPPPLVPCANIEHAVTVNYFIKKIVSNKKYIVILIN